MLVKELREKIEKYNKKDLENLVVLLYKKIPKKIKEENDIDIIIQENNVNYKKEEPVLNIIDLKAEVDYFLDCAYEGLYRIPNKIIPKNERSKWRFKAKSFYKQLCSFDPKTKEGIESTQSLMGLFKALSYGTASLLFSSWNTFGALGVSQLDYYYLLCQRILINGYSDENLEKCINLIFVENDRDVLPIELFYVFSNFLHDKESKLKAINIFQNKINEIKEKINETKDYNSLFYLNEDKNLSVESIVNLYLDLNLIDEAISYFHKNYNEKDKEVKEYIILTLLEDYELYEEWIIEYEKHNVEYRESLKEKYREFKKNNN